MNQIDKIQPSVVTKVIAYEDGELSNEDTISLFQELLDSGLVWKLQGHYGRTMCRLIDAGLVIDGNYLES